MLGAMMKPLGAPFFPLLLLLSWARYGLARTFVGGATAVLVLALVFSPFILSGQLGPTVDRVFGDALLMAHTSSNAHNLWWVVGAWRDSEAPWLGPLTATHVSMILFALFYGVVLWKAHRLQRAQSGGIREPQVLVLTLLIAFTFFMVATHMHENHLFAAVPLALPLVLVRGSWGRRGVWIYAAISLAVLLNLVLHDPKLTLHPPFSWGGPTGAENPHLERPLLVGERWAIRISTLFNLALFAGLLGWSFRPRGWLDRLGDREEERSQDRVARAVMRSG
jgi:hypothetical protein